MVRHPTLTTFLMVAAFWLLPTTRISAAFVADPDLLNDFEYPLRSRINEAFAGLTLSYHGSLDPGWIITGEVVRMHTAGAIVTDLLGYRVAHTTFNDYYGTSWGTGFFGRYILRVDLETPTDAVFAEVINYGSSNKTAQLTAYDADGVELGRTYKQIWEYATPSRIQYEWSEATIDYFTVTNYVSSIFGFQIDRAGTGRLEDNDFDADGNVDVNDVNQLLDLGDLTAGISVVVGLNDGFDLNGDGLIDEADLDRWLADAAVLNGLGSPYKRGDANLNSIVDASDFNLWNAAKFSTLGRWDRGDFNGDGLTDVADFNYWNVNKFTVSDAVQSLPEPMSVTPLLVIASALLWRCRIASRNC